MVPNAEGNLVKLLRSKLTGEARRFIIGNYYNNLEDFISKLKTIFAPSKTVYQLQGDLGRIYIYGKTKAFYPMQHVYKKLQQKSASVVGKIITGKKLLNLKEIWKEIRSIVFSNF